MDNGCPWSSYLPATVSFCEAQLCAIIVKPAEAWSNIAYVLLGLYTLHRANRESNTHMCFLGVIGIILGIGSFIFHATGTFFGEFLDVSGMFMYVALGLTVGLRRWFRIPLKQLKWYFLLLQGSSMTLLWFIKPIGILLFSLQFAAILAMEIALYRRDKKRFNYKYYFIFVGSFALAWVIWWLDKLGIVCDPDNHIFNGHSAWHVITSFSFYFNYQFLKQIPELKSDWPSFGQSKLCPDPR